MITYEYPFSERIRTLLRLDDLFEKTDYFRQCEGRNEHHASLINLFEILEVAFRSDLRLDLIGEIDRQKQVLHAFRNSPNISQEALNSALTEMESASNLLHSMTGKIGHALRANEWLMNVKSRAAIPGGLCEFDLPSYHQWLHQSSETRQIALEAWTRTLLPLRTASALVLRLLRASGRSEPCIAQQGGYQKMLNASNAQLVRIQIHSHDDLTPEISANRYALNIRFTQPNGSDLRLRQVAQDVSFDIILCNL